MRAVLMAALTSAVLVGCGVTTLPGDGGNTLPDAAVDAPDAGVTSPDAGSPDSGTPDSGTPDSGSPASGTPDAGYFPDAGSLPPPSVQCSPTPCTRPRTSQSSTCSRTEECVITACDATTCRGYCFPGLQLEGRCDATGCCTFVCDGFAGALCPTGMTCNSSPECCDQFGTCTLD